MNTYHLLLSLALCLLTLSAHAAPRYTVTDLGTLRGFSSFVGAVNNQGQIAGENFLWDNGKETFLPRPYATGWGDDDQKPQQSDVRAHAINTLGHIVGGFGGFQPLSMSGLYDCFPFFYANGKMQNLAQTDKGPGDYESFEAFGINDKDEIVGVHAHHGFYWARGKRIEFGTLRNRQTGTESFSKINAINNKGQFVGLSTVAGQTTYPYYRTHAVVWVGPKHGGHWKDLGVPVGFTDSEAVAINDFGAIAGKAKRAEEHWWNIMSRAVLWQNGRITLLPLLAGETLNAAQGINNAGEVVGWCSHSARYATEYASFNTAVLWKNGEAVDLNSLLPPNSGWTLHEAKSINNYGWIVGTGTFHNWVHTFLLRPQ